ncbi:hydrolase [Aestuariibacter salexigens]|uniref:hydrolase n=1 Tax=Aestuariibacter salexigens TaxID=226010 RepID=UPI0003F62E9E|nr:hydrolase [Aestuariibacter salexigens]
MTFQKQHTEGIEPEVRQNEYGDIVDSGFAAPWWARNRHVQTIWPRFMQKRRKLHYRMQRMELPDGDFVDVAWSQHNVKKEGVVLLFHGLEGSIRSHYANDVMAVMADEGYQVAMMHFRGCSGEPNRTTRAYHSGETEDAQYFLEYIQQRFPSSRKIAIGFSLGANMLLKMLGELPKQQWLNAVAAVSPPMRLAECAESINHGFSRFYQRYLLESMRGTLLKKFSKLDYSGLKSLTLERIKSMRSFREFDEWVTAPLHGFANAEHYYQVCSSHDYLSKIETPTLIVHSLDDPFMNHNVIPRKEALSPSVRLELSEKGGHVGFMQGSPWRPKIWLHERLRQFVNQHLATE